MKRKSWKSFKRSAASVHSNAEIMGGTPVFRGTRIPVHLVADMLRQGASPEEILEGYPSLTRNEINHARIYAAAHPERARQADQPWSGKKPLRQKKSRFNGT
jgi:uncharacterized protein (DUF433 family)